ncbi:ATP-dependent helicase HrpB [Vulcanococcus sp. Clear-D1]|uniref:ATP-dependent helicase HrpB n=1 Tax=Vulcanococcus sp. Clear-D1 TaxID=2766970 RepID=UPI0019BC3476|nr:ATP-dependent helicase HrpB [Vulcanococcus sp. Clear-D1]MBD1192786.1 ATP-dependent helicase HrpB [Vulcanococcus sp. Clear-D1]
MPLPIEPLLPELVQRLPAGGTVLLQAPPGAGKTTRVPLALLEACGGRILMLEPRRLAAKAAAERLATELDERVGERVGYRVRLESRISAATRLEVLTDGLFLRQLQADPSLEGVECVIFDEFHERRCEADLALALLREARELLMPELRLLVMSATLNLQPLVEQLPEAALLTSEGRSHPVSVSHQPPREREALPAQVVRALEAHWLDQRDASETVLVFLPGQRELRACQDAIAATGWGRELELCLLHGNLPLAEQSQAIRPASKPAGKVVLATAIAESSLTIEGVSLVIDSGLSRRSRFDPVSGMESLVTVPASLASAEQRAGRAGRLGPGRALRLWSPAEQQRRPAFDPPAVMEADPAPLVLQLAEWGAGLGETLPWLEPPPEAHLREGQELLRQLGALEEGGNLNAHGRRLANLGVHPRLAQLLLRSCELGAVDLGCSLAALLSERDPLSQLEAGSDLMRRLDWLRSAGRDPRGQQLRQLQQQLRRQLPEQPSLAGAPADREAAVAAELLAYAYPERVALERTPGSGRYLTRSGRGAVLHPNDPLVGSPALAIAAADGSGSDARIQLALPLAPNSLTALALSAGEELAQVCWDSQHQRIRAERELRLGALVLERRPWPDAPASVLRTALLTGLAELGLEALPWDGSSRQLQQRLCLAHRELGSPWPDRSLTALASDPSSWLADQLDGLRSRADLQGLNLTEALWNGLPWDARRELEVLLPEAIEIPSGRLAQLDYSGGEPVLAVKLQELFGAASTPTVLGGRLPVTVQLLSPAGRPAAITQDLAGFWNGTYQEVRKELRGRYPRHPWPEDPANTPATALTNRALQRRQSQR